MDINVKCIFQCLNKRGKIRVRCIQCLDRPIVVQVAQLVANLKIDFYFKKVFSGVSHLSRITSEGVS